MSENQEVQASLPIPFFPASLCQPERNGPQLPQNLPQLRSNATPVEVADEDKETGDKWVKRNPELVRLTGKTPFNSEARLGVLFEAGFLTPAHLHYVRNHGVVPQVTDDAAAAAWTIRVHGLVEREVTLTLQELQKQFTVVTLPVTLVCAGNRRKEQNVVNSTLGFNWGAAAVSTALWTGVYLADILDYVRPSGTAKYVVFEGGDDLQKGPYGTSQRLSWAANKDKGMLISWAMNGLPLEPDHGFPVRVIVPGQIGGRSVKWLKRIEISDRESQHYLHFRDNKVLPTQVTSEQARKEEHWWKNPNYIITELNVNSAIAKPDHNEKLYINKSASYSMQGYAYAGGGRRVTRVEVSLDEGETWILARVDYPEDRFREASFKHSVYGILDLTRRDTSFCWCFWTFDVSHDVLATCDALMVRAMDEGLGFQQRDMYWHAMGMMNNWWFRVGIIKTTDDDEKTILQFEHPTLAGAARGGWMERMKAAGEDITKPVFNEKGKDRSHRPNPQPDEICLINPDITRKITPEQLTAQDRKEPWFVVKGQVYDGTPFLKDHPGGSDTILHQAGKDASEDFIDTHSTEGKKQLATYHIGTLDGTLAQEEPDSDGAFLQPSTWKRIRLCGMRQINHDSVFYRFALPIANQPLGLPVGQHVFVRLRRKDTGDRVLRQYTPVSQQDAVGFVDFLIKLYLPCESFPNGGKMTTGFHKLCLGDSVEVKGPLGSFIWNGPSAALWKEVKMTVNEVGMICGGSGITPILQVLRSILQNPKDETRVWLISANRTERDILCREEFDLHFKTHSKRFKLHYTVSVAPDNLKEWPYSVGRITNELLATYMPKPSAQRLILACGPDAMISQTVKPGLREMGWNIETSLVVF